MCHHIASAQTFIITANDTLLLEVVVFKSRISGHFLVHKDVNLLVNQYTAGIPGFSPLVSSYVKLAHQSTISQSVSSRQLEHLINIFILNLNKNTPLIRHHFCIRLHHRSKIQNVYFQTQIKQGASVNFTTQWLKVTI